MICMIKLHYDLVDSNIPSQVVTISENGLTVFCGRGGNRHIITNYPIPTKDLKIYFEYTLIEMVVGFYDTICMQFGLSSLDGKNAYYYYPWTRLTGGNNYVYKYINGVLNYVNLGTSYRHTVNVDDVVGLESSKGNFTIYKNGTKIVTISVPDNLIYPAVYNGTIGDDYTFTANFGNSPLKYKPNDCISLEEAYQLYKDHELKIY